MFYFVAAFLLMNVVPSLVLSAASINRMPGVEYLGVGYDLVRGNPRPLETSGPDRGFVYPIFNMNRYESGRKATSKHYDIPDGTIARDCYACHLMYQSSTVESASEYTDSLKQQAKIGVHAGGSLGKLELSASFKSSDSYSTTIKDITTNKQVLIDTRMRCASYCYSIDEFSTPSFEQSFESAVASLPTNYSTDSNKASYNRVLSRFGTHFVGTMTSGSIFWQRSKMSTESFSKMVNDFSKSEVEQSAELKFGSWFKASETTTFTNEREKQAYNNFTKSTTDIRMYAMGAAPKQTSNGNGPVDLAQWQEDTLKWLMPIEYSLFRLETLFSSAFFPHDGQIDAKRSALMLALDGYCEYVALQTGKNINCAPEIEATTPKPRYLSWVAARVNETIPTDAVRGTFLESSPYICRVNYANELVSGYAYFWNGLLQHCYITHNGKPVPLVVEYELLTNPEQCTLAWQQNCCGAVAQGAVRGGREGGEATYVGEDYLNENGKSVPVIGRIIPSRKAMLGNDYWCCNSEKEKQYTNYNSLYSTDCLSPL